jgi:hypothetical protein
MHAWSKEKRYWLTKYNQFLKNQNFSEALPENSGRLRDNLG